MKKNESLNKLYVLMQICTSIWIEYGYPKIERLNSWNSDLEEITLSDKHYELKISVFDEGDGHYSVGVRRTQKGFRPNRVETSFFISGSIIEFTSWMNKLKWTYYL